MFRRVDRLFHRYQRTRDPRALGAVFDRTAPELLRVARHLTADPHRAEDLVQATFLTAIERADQYDAHRPLLPWLLAILANRAREWYRADRSRREEPPSVEAARGPATEVVDEAAARELAAACDRALDRLPQPYRHVLILHLRHHLSSAEIARALDHPASTVRNQVARGMNMLRRGLPAWSASAAAVAVTGQGLPAVRETVLAHAAVSTALGAAATSHSLLFGGLLVSHKMSWTLVALALLTLTAGAWSLHSDIAPPSAGGRSSEVTSSQREGRANSANAAGPDAEREIVDKPRENFGSLRIEVVFRGSGERASGVEYELRQQDIDAHPAPGDREGWTAADGTVTLTELPAGRYTVVIWSRPKRLAEASVTIEAGRLSVTRLEIAAGWSIRGTVVDRTGHPMHGARVLLSQHGTGRVVARSAADGSFRVGSLRGDVHEIWAMAAGRQPSQRQNVEARVGTADVKLVLGDAGARLRGVVKDRNGRRAEGAKIYIGVPFPSKTPFREHRTHSLVAKGGTFEVDWLPSGRHFVGALPASGDRARGTGQWIDVAKDGDAQVVLHLGDGARLVGRVRNAATGESMREVTVSIGISGDYGLGAFQDWTVATDAEGRYELSGLVGGTYRLVASRGAKRVTARMTMRRATEHRWDPAFDPGGAVRVRLLDPDGEPLARWPVRVRRPHPMHTWVFGGPGFTDQAGRCVFSNLELVEHQLQGLAQGFTVVVFTRSGIMPLPGRAGAEVIVQLRSDQMPTARLRGRVVDARGKSAPDAKVTMVQAGGGWVHTFNLSPEGRFKSSLLPPGGFRISIRVPGTTAAASSARYDLVAEQDRDLGELVLPNPANLEVRLVAADGAPVEGAVLRLGQRALEDPGAFHMVADEVSGVYHAKGHAAGDYVLRFFATDALPQLVAVKLVAGQTKRLTLAVERGRRIVLELRCAEDNPKAGGLINGKLEVYDARSGRRLVFHRLFGYFDDWKKRIKLISLGLAPGRYRIHAHEYRCKEVDLEIVVPADGAMKRFVIDLR